jgi:putative transposase
VKGNSGSASMEDCLNNAAIARNFGILKTEFFYINKFDRVDELRNCIKKYIQYDDHGRTRMKLKG